MLFNYYRPASYFFYPRPPIQTVQSPLSALHAWAFVPVPIGTSQELVHSIEHRIFLDVGISALEDTVVRHNGMIHWTGILLDFTIRPERLGDLVSALENVFCKPLPKLTFEERERFVRELEDGDGDFFDRAIERYKIAFFEANGFRHSWKDEESIWESLEFSETRFFWIGQVPSHGGVWAPRIAEAPVFPVLREELPEFEPESGEGGGGWRFDGFEWGEDRMDYALLFPSAVGNARDFAFHQLFFRFLRQKTDADFRDTGRTYDPVSESYFEDGFAVSGIHLMTSDQKKRLPELPKKPDRQSFERFRDAVAFQISIDQDQLSYGAYPTMGIPPMEARDAVANFPYAEFVEKYAGSCERVSFFWGKSGE